jgi:hypothetical protein
VNDEKILLNEIDLNVSTIILWAEMKCKWVKGHDWSPLIANAGCMVIAAKWNLSNIMMGCTKIQMNVNHDEAITKARSQIKDAYGNN